MKFFDGNFFAWQVRHNGRKVIGDANPFLDKMIKMKEAAPTWVCFMARTQMSCISILMLSAMIQHVGRVM
jgi:hypothetical protein